MRKLFITLLFTNLTALCFAQLPKLEVVTARGRNIISWVNQYPTLESIDVQRSTDSTGKKFVSIGTLKKPKKGNNAFSDDVPLKGNNTYQLLITFNEDVIWYSNKKSIYMDSILVASSMQIDTTTAKDAAKNKAIEANPTLAIEEIKPEFTFIPSNHVFTNTYTGHINIEVENAVSKRYSLAFYGNNNKEVLKIDRINIDKLVLDKHNFNGKGTFTFKLFESGKEIEKGFVNVY